MSRTDYDVCLVIETAAMTLDDLTKRIGVSPTDASHNAGDPHLIRTRGVWKTTAWQFCSGCAQTTAVEDQFEAIARNLSPRRMPEVRPGSQSAAGCRDGAHKLRGSSDDDAAGPPYA